VENGTIVICYATCADEVKLVQMRGGTQHSYAPCADEVKLVQTLVHVEHSICYATCANEVELVQMRGGTQYNIHLFCSLCR